MQRSLRYRISTLCLALSSTLPASATDQFEEVRNYQMRQANNLIRNHKPQNFYIQNTMAAPIVVTIFYRQHIDDDLENDSLLGLLAPEDCSYVDVSGIDSNGVFNITAKHPGDTLYLTESRKGSKESDAFVYIQSLTIKSGETRTIITRPLSSVARLNLDTPGVIPHFKRNDTGINIELSEKSEISLPLTATPTDFTALLSAYDNMPTTRQVASVVNFRKAFSCQVLAGEDIAHKDYVAKLQELYNNASKSPLTISICRIPLITHTLWTDATTLNSLFSSDNSDWLQQTIQSCPQAEGWQHYIWLPTLMDVKSAAQTVPDHLSDKVHFKALAELTTFKKDYLTKGSHALASKILRFHVLNQYGGVVRGSDIEIIQSLKAFNGAYDLYCGLDSNGTAPSTSLLAAKPGHPVIQKAIELVDRNLDENSKPEYLKALTCNTTIKEANFNYIMFGFDNGLLATALVQASDPQVTIDMVLPPHIFNMKRKAIDIKHAEDIRQQWSPEAMAIHYLVRHWNK